MLVSVIIPAYNADRFVADAIQSALAQTYAEQEIIVVNDGSTDRTASVVERFGNAIRRVDQPNRGLSAARNRGIADARGELIAFLDADDLWHPEKLERQVELLTGTPDVGLVHTDAQKLDDVSGQCSPAPAERGEYQGNCFEAVWRGNRMSVSSVVVRRNLLEQHGVFDEKIRRPTTQDYELWLRLSRHTKFGYIDRVLTTCRHHEHNASRNKIAMVEDVLYVLEKTLREYPQLRSLVGSKAARQRIAHVYRSAAYLYFTAAQIPEARRALWQSLRRNPRDLTSWKAYFRACLDLLRTQSRSGIDRLRFQR